MSNEPTDDRELLMTALSGLEHLIANAPTPPSDFSYNGTDTPVSVKLHFRAADHVHAFAGVYGVDVRETPGENHAEAYVDTEARGDGNGVTFLAWARTYRPPLSQSPAALLGQHLQGTQFDVDHIEVVSDSSLRVRVRPGSLDCWRWWLARFNVAFGAVELDGQDVTAIGCHGDITVHLTGLGVEQLAHIPPADVSEQRSQPAVVMTLAAAAGSVQAVTEAAVGGGR